MSRTAGLPPYETPTSWHAITTSRSDSGFAPPAVTPPTFTTAPPSVRCGAGPVAAFACCSRLSSVICWDTFLSPLSLVTVAEPDRRRVHREQDHEQDDDGCGGQDLEVLLRARDPVEDLDRERRELAVQAVGVEGHEGQRTEQHQRRGFADRAREREDRAGGDARDRR